MLKQICDALTALRQYILQTHWSARNKAYSAHLLTDRIYSGIAEDIDRLKELHIGVSDDLSIASADNTFKDALNYLRILSVPNPQDATPKQLQTCLLLEQTVSDIIQQAISYYESLPETTRFRAGILNALGDIDEKRARDVYLIKTELSQ